MHFAPDSELTLVFAVDLVNTVAGATRSGLDELADQPSLTSLLDRHGYTGRFDRDAAELGEVRDVRTLLRQLWLLDRDASVEVVNRMLAETKALPRLERHDAMDWHLHPTSSSAPLADRIKSEVALAFVDVIRSSATDRLRRCAADDCDGLLFDVSRNGSKRFCGVRCSNRMNTIAFRERQAAG